MSRLVDTLAFTMRAGHGTVDDAFICPSCGVQQWASKTRQGASLYMKDHPEFPHSEGCAWKAEFIRASAPSRPPRIVNIFEIDPDDEP